jgi:hypothetical protein
MSPVSVPMAPRTWEVGRGPGEYGEITAMGLLDPASVPLSEPPFPANKEAQDLDAGCGAGGSTTSVWGD